MVKRIMQLILLIGRTIYPVSSKTKRWVTIASSSKLKVLNLKRKRKNRTQKGFGQTSISGK